MAYRILAIAMTLSGLQGHALTLGLLKCNFLTLLRQLTRSQLTARRAVPLRQLGVLLTDVELTNWQVWS